MASRLRFLLFHKNYLRLETLTFPYRLKEPTASERQSPTVPPATNPDPQLQIEEYDALGAQIEMSAQHNRIHEADIQFRNFLRQRPHPIKPSSGGHDEASFLHPTSSRPADTEAAIREALARQGDSGNSAAASNRTGYNPQAQEWNPDDRDKDSEGQQGGGADSDQGKSFVPEAEALHPSGEQAGQAGGENER